MRDNLFAMVEREHRDKAGLTLRALARTTGIDNGRLSRLENRQEKIWRGDISRLRKALPSLEGVEIAGADRMALLAPEE